MPTNLSLFLPEFVQKTCKLEDQVLSEWQCKNCKLVRDKHKKEP